VVGFGRGYNKEQTVSHVSTKGLAMSQPATDASVSATPPPGSTVIDFDHFDPAVIEDPTPTWASMRAATGVWSPRYGGFHVLSRYADVLAGAGDPTTLSSAQGVNIPALPFPPFIPLEVDPPDHREYRKILNVRMSPEVVEEHLPSIRALAVELLDKISGLPEVDLMKAFAAPFPKTVALRLVGYPDEDLAKIDNWVEHIVGEHKEREGAAEMAGEFFAYLQAFVEQRRAAPTRPDLMSALLEGTLNEEPLTDSTIIPMLLLLTFGGLHTTTSAIGGMLLWLADNPEGRQELRDHPHLIPTAVDEFLRYTTPVNQMARTATRDSSLGGCPMHAGDKVLLAFGAANRDPEMFSDADKVVLDRSPNRHLSFGAGPHRCVGSHYARAMVQVALEEGLNRLGEFEVTDRSKLIWTGGEARGLRALPVALKGR
jgi:cytochrome P450